MKGKQIYQVLFRNNPNEKYSAVKAYSAIEVYHFVENYKFVVINNITDCEYVMP